MNLLDINKRKKEIKRSKDGTLVLELEKNEEYSIAYGELLPREKNKKHKMEMKEIFYILSGKGQITIEGEKIELKKDCMIVIDTGKEQTIENIGKRKLRFLMIVKPPYDPKKEKILE